MQTWKSHKLPFGVAMETQKSPDIETGIQVECIGFSLWAEGCLQNI